MCRYIRVRVDLRAVVGAAAARARVLLRVPAGRRARALPAAWLLRRLRALLGPLPPAAPGRLALRVAGHLLPPREALGVLRPGDTVVVFPLSEEENILYHDADRVLPMDDEAEVPNRGKRDDSERGNDEVDDIIGAQPSGSLHSSLTPEHASLEEEKRRALQLLEAVRREADRGRGTPRAGQAANGCDTLSDTAGGTEPAEPWGGQYSNGCDTEPVDQWSNKFVKKCDSKYSTEAANQWDSQCGDGRESPGGGAGGEAERAPRRRRRARRRRPRASPPASPAPAAPADPAALAAPAAPAAPAPATPAAPATLARLRMEAAAGGRPGRTVRALEQL